MQPILLLTCLAGLALGTLESEAAIPTAKLGWVPKANKAYNLQDLDPSEVPYISQRAQRFDWLEHVFKAMVTIEDTTRAGLVLKKIKAWGKAYYKSNPQFQERSEQLQSAFVEFLVRLRELNAVRKQKCPDLPASIQQLYGKDYKPISSPCPEFTESAEEKSRIDAIFQAILLRNLSEANHQLNQAPDIKRVQPPSPSHAHVTL